MDSEKKAEEYYDTAADDYDERREEPYIGIIDDVMWSHIEEVLATIKKGRILDAGGGTGQWSIKMAEKGFDVTLVDLSEKMIQLAEKKAEEAHLTDKITFKKASLSDLEFENEWFDAVVCVGEVLSCLDFDLLGQVMGEIARVLKKGGKIILTGANRYFFSVYYLSASIEKARDMLTTPTIEAPDNPKALLFSKGELETVLAAHNMALEKAYGIGVLTLMYKEYLQGKDLKKEDIAYLKELECALSQQDGVKEISPSMLVVGIKQ